MKTIKLYTYNSLFGVEKHECTVNITERQLKGILYLFTIDTQRFDYEETLLVNEEKETAESLWEKFFIHIFQNRELVLIRLKGILN